MIKNLELPCDQPEEIHQIFIDELRGQIELLSSFDRILVAGGDGTISSLLPYLLNKPACVGIIPLGTGNDLAKELGVYRRFSEQGLKQMIDFYCKAQSRPLSIWRMSYGPGWCQNVLFCNYVSFGYEAAAVADFAAWRRGRAKALFSGKFGNRLGYSLAALKNIPKAFVASALVHRQGKKCYEISGRPVRSVLVSNIQSIAGLGTSNPDSSGFDDCIEVLIVRGLKDYFSMLFPKTGLFSQGLKLGSAQSWIIEDLPPGTAIQIDGEARRDMEAPSFRIELAGSINMAVAI